MDDRFLEDLRRDPEPGFARDLRARLRARSEDRRAWAPRLVPALGLAFAALAVAGLFAFPAVRASAQAMLDLFRVRRFAAVTYDAARVEKLRSLQGAGDPSLMVFERRETVLDPGPARAFPDAGAAGAAAGLTLRRADHLPAGLAPDSVFVQGAGEMRLSVSEARLRALLDALDLRDVAVPAGIDGRIVDVRKPPVVIQKFRGPRSRAALLQCDSPEIAVPAGMDIERLAEIGLRVIGLDASEARRVARETDWRTTLVVPVPLNASTFRQVTVHGEPGLLITTARRDAEGQRRREGTMVMWTEGGRVLAIVGDLDPSDTMEMAESVR
jgi:hypothetical protein